LSLFCSAEACADAVVADGAACAHQVCGSAGSCYDQVVRVAGTTDYAEIVRQLGDSVTTVGHLAGNYLTIQKYGVAFQAG
jgi:hypothetical protein